VDRRAMQTKFLCRDDRDLLEITTQDGREFYYQMPNCAAEKIETDDLYFDNPGFPTKSNFVVYDGLKFVRSLRP
jgi:hypothetical protein